MYPCHHRLHGVLCESNEAHHSVTVTNRTYLIDTFDGVFCVDVRVIDRHETRFNHHA